MGNGPSAMTPPSAPSAQHTRPQSPAPALESIIEVSSAETPDTRIFPSARRSEPRDQRPLPYIVVPNGLVCCHNSLFPSTWPTQNITLFLKALQSIREEEITTQMPTVPLMTPYTESANPLNIPVVEAPVSYIIELETHNPDVGRPHISGTTTDRPETYYLLRSDLTKGEKLQWTFEACEEYPELAFLGLTVGEMEGWIQHDADHGGSAWLNRQDQDEEMEVRWNCGDCGITGWVRELRIKT